MVNRADTEVMGGSRINVQLYRNICLLQSKVHQNAVLRGAYDIGSAVR